MPPAELTATMLGNDWPGNVRELRSAVERMLLLDDPELWAQIGGIEAATGVEETDPAQLFDWTLSFRAVKELAVSKWERAYLRALIERNDGNVSGSAREARMDRNYLRELLRRHGLR